MGRSSDSYTRLLETSRKWKKANPERHAELARAYRARNSEKTKAQNAVNYAIRMGRLVRGCCEKCGTNEKVHGHHADYSEPLQVNWLCFRCHKDTHPVDEEDKRVKFEQARRARMSGESNPMAKLDNETVEVVKKALAQGIVQQRIADILGVSQQAISRIALGKTYSSK